MYHACGRHACRQHECSHSTVYFVPHCRHAPVRMQCGACGSGLTSQGQLMGKCSTLDTWLCLHTAAAAHSDDMDTLSGQPYTAQGAACSAGTALPSGARHSTHRTDGAIAGGSHARTADRYNRHRIAGDTLRCPVQQHACNARPRRSTGAAHHAGSHPGTRSCAHRLHMHSQGLSHGTDACIVNGSSCRDVLSSRCCGCACAGASVSAEHAGNGGTANPSRASSMQQ
jgi:hypothetical protein